jgi:hypothetical protein
MDLVNQLIPPGHHLWMKLMNELLMSDTVELGCSELQMIVKSKVVSSELS